jgi:hypothetical protein
MAINDECIPIFYITPCASPPPWPSIFSDYSFSCPPLNRHLFALGMTSDFTVTWQFSQSEQMFFLLRVILHDCNLVPQGCGPERLHLEAGPGPAGAAGRAGVLQALYDAPGDEPGAAVEGQSQEHCQRPGGHPTKSFGLITYKDL